MKLAIVAGGKGSRLSLKDIPKVMAEVAGKPLLEHQINLAKRYGIKDIYILSGYKAGAIIDYFGDGRKLGVNITHITEDKPLGTAGAFRQLKGKIDERIMVFYGDTLMDVDLSQMMVFDALSESIATILVHPNDHPYDSDLVDVDKDNKVTAFYLKPHKEGWYYKNIVNAALFILSPEILKYIPDHKPSGLEKDIFPLVLGRGGVIRAYKTPEYIKDIGTPERLIEITKDFLSGKVARLNKAYKRKAVFLDRDGVINKEAGDLSDINDFELLSGSAAAIKKINNSEYLTVVVTNQPLIAKGFCPEDELIQIHKKMETLLSRGNAYIDGLYYCPHHPQKGFEGEISELKIDCECRKPKPKMIFDAAKEFNVDLENSFLIGDRYRDIATGRNAGVRTILVKTGQAGGDKTDFCVEADHISKDLSAAVDYILR